MIDLVVVGPPLAVLIWLAINLTRLSSPGGPDVEPWGEPTSEPWYPTPPEEPDSWGWDDEDDDVESLRSLRDSGVALPRLRVSSAE
jgi:hypothetical protein